MCRGGGRGGKSLGGAGDRRRRARRRRRPAARARQEAPAAAAKGTSAGAKGSGRPSPRALHRVRELRGNAALHEMMTGTHSFLIFFRLREFLVIISLAAAGRRKCSANY